MTEIYNWLIAYDNKSELIWDVMANHYINASKNSLFKDSSKVKTIMELAAENNVQIPSKTFTNYNNIMSTLFSTGSIDADLLNNLISNIYE